jgi:hypothetical protein
VTDVRPENLREEPLGWSNTSLLEDVYELSAQAHHRWVHASTVPGNLQVGGMIVANNRRIVVESSVTTAAARWAWRGVSAKTLPG